MSSIMDQFQQSTQRNSSFEAAPLSNPPPQYFGGDGTAASPPMPDFSFNDGQTDGQDQDGGQDESNDAKRRRIARVRSQYGQWPCLKVDGCCRHAICVGRRRSSAMERCRHVHIASIIKRSAYSPRSRRNAILLKGRLSMRSDMTAKLTKCSARYIEGLENRLGRMESLLKLSGLLNEEDDDRTDLGALERRLVDKTNTQPSGGAPTPRSAKSDSQPRALSSQHNTPQMGMMSTPSASPGERTKEKEEAVEELSDMMCSLVTNNCGETRYIGEFCQWYIILLVSFDLGSSSGFSIFSPKGIQWVNEKTGDTSFQEMIASASMNDIKWAFWKPEVFEDMFARRTYQQLPPRGEALSLLKDFFENFNCMFPLFHEPTFMHLVNRNYSRSPYEGSGWWASLNVALAIAHRLRVMSNLVPQEEDKKAWGFLKNAMGVLTELTMRNTDLLSVQALLGMVNHMLPLQLCHG